MEAGRPFGEGARVGSTPDISENEITEPRIFEPETRLGRYFPRHHESQNHQDLNNQSPSSEGMGTDVRKCSSEPIEMPLEVLSEKSLGVSHPRRKWTALRDCV